ncbi:MAG TPA: hypothetical protein VLV78_04890 [Thermoanaerobaculia bacterium]|nr:hypothetical protein [Thermoanaerobaculia bacterium]
MKQILRIAVSVLILTNAGVAAAQDCVALCKRPTGDDLIPDHVIIDANTGDPIGGRTRFPQVSRVQIVFVNKNPFKYVYRFDVLTTSLTESIIKDGLQLLGATIPSGTKGAAPPATKECDSDKVSFDEFTKASDSVDAAEKTLSEALGPYGKAMTAYDDFVKLTADDKIDCDTVCPKAQSLLPNLDLLIDGVTTIDNDVNALAKAVDDARAKHTALLAAINKEVTDQAKLKRCLKSADNADDRLQAVEQRLPKYKEARDKAADDKNQKRFDELRKLIRSLTSTSFVETRFATTTGPSEVKVTVFRRNIREEGTKEAQVGAPVSLQVGESRFSISGGIGWSTINQSTIVRQVAPNPDDKTTTIEVFGQQNKSHLLPQAVALLNARIGGDFNMFKSTSMPASFAWSAGVVVLDTADSAGNSYLTGPSLVLNDNAFVVSLLFQSARVERLASGFQPGQKIPADIKGALPVDRNRAEGVLLAFTYRTR